MRKEIFELNAQMMQIDSALEENGGELTEEIQVAINEAMATQRNVVDNLCQLIDKDDADIVTLNNLIEMYTKMRDDRIRHKKSITDGAREFMKNNSLSSMLGDIRKMTLVKGRRSVMVDNDVFNACFSELFASIREMLPSYIDVKFSPKKAEIKDVLENGDSSITFATIKDGDESLRIK